MLTPEDSRKLGWVPYVMDFSFEESARFTAAIASAHDLDDLPQWVKDAAYAADHKVGVRIWSLAHHDLPGEIPRQRLGSGGLAARRQGHDAGTINSSMTLRSGPDGVPKRGS
jgi:hypothetical protein